jgi:hypothetical protein
VADARVETLAGCGQRRAPAGDGAKMFRWPAADRSAAYHLVSDERDYRRRRTIEMIKTRL